MARPPAEDLSGRLVDGKYLIEGLIGRGGMGAVYRATHQLIGKRVALKFLSREAAQNELAVGRFLREAQAASAVSSAHIVTVFDVGKDEGRPFLVMELLDGEDLRARLKRERQLPVEDVVLIGTQVARALARAHDAGIVHRDLKPDNLFLTRADDGSLLVKVVDFGISKILESTGVDTLTGGGAVLGTPHYMAPEQAQGLAVDGRSDLFSVGAILHEALAGSPPFTGPSYEAILVKICTQDAPPVRSVRADVPDAVARIVDRLLARDPASRPADGRTLLAELVDAAPDVALPRSLPGLGPAPTPVRLVGGPERDRPPSQLGRAAMIGGLTAGVIAAVVVATRVTPAEPELPVRSASWVASLPVAKDRGFSDVGSAESAAPDSSATATPSASASAPRPRPVAPSRSGLELVTDPDR